MGQLQDHRTEQRADDRGDTSDRGDCVEDADEPGAGREVDDDGAADHHRPPAAEALDEPGGHHDRDRRRESAPDRREQSSGLSPATNSRRRPRWSETGPPISCPRPMPAKNVVRVSWTWVAPVDRSSATRGKAGTYMSVASGAIAVRNTTVATSAVVSRTGYWLPLAGCPAVVARYSGRASPRRRCRFESMGQGRRRTLMARRSSMAR